MKALQPGPWTQFPWHSMGSFKVSTSIAYLLVLFIHWVLFCNGGSILMYLIYILFFLVCFWYGCSTWCMRRYWWWWSTNTTGEQQTTTTCFRTCSFWLHFVTLLGNCASLCRDGHTSSVTTRFRRKESHSKLSTILPAGKQAAPKDQIPTFKGRRLLEVDSSMICPVIDYSVRRI